MNMLYTTYRIYYYILSLSEIQYIFIDIEVNNGNLRIDKFLNLRFFKFLKHILRNTLLIFAFMYINLKDKK